MVSGRALAARHDAAGRHDDAVNALAVASRNGDIEAMTALGTRMLVGDHAPYLPREAVGLLTEAARGGSVAAALRLACVTALGVHVTQSWNGALALLVHAAERGAESARGQLRLLAGTDAEHDGDWRALAHAIDLPFWLSPAEGQTLHDEPLVRRFPSFLHPALCGWLIEKAKGRLRRAMIYSGKSTHDTVDEMRTNSVAVWHLGCMDLINAVLQYRIAAACRMPIENLEAPTALRYQAGEQITNHYDYINPRNPNYQNEIETRGERIITFLTYLNDDYDGGETDFPAMNLRHRGKLGEALLFRNALPSTKADDRSLHAGLPPSRGEKWVVSQFVRSKPVFNTPAENVAY